MGILPSPHGGLEIQIAKPPSIENSIGSVQGITFFLQCQLLEPEAELDKHDEASWHNGTINSRLSLKRWETFSKKKAREDQFPEKRVMELQHEIKQKLKEYRTYFTYHGSWQPQMFMIAFNRPLESTSWTFLCFLFCIATEG